jgi:carbamoyl-phosphate synthase large subunit
MPKRTDIKKILIIGSGPIVIGQACEFDYSGAQACKALLADGYQVVLVNSNPATIMTDPQFAHRTYIEPVTPETVARVIEKERPDALLPTLGGQTGLNTAVKLADMGVLEKFGVEMIGANRKAIHKAEDRLEFKQAMERIGLKCAKSAIARSMDEARKALASIGLPAVLRASFALGGTGSGIAFNVEQFEEIAARGLDASMIGEILIEQYLDGWKEFEMEVIRDRKDNVVIICSIENFDPMGVHTGDSITVAPAQTLTDKEYQLMRDASIAVIREIGVETGGSNIQFAINPKDGDMIVIEMNPRVSRSSALASKATGYPIAKIAAKLAVGYTLDELPNDITSTADRRTAACFEPTIDYTVVKIPRFTFEKFPEADDGLTTQMKSVGEAMAIGRTFKEALQKCVRSMEQKRAGLGLDGSDLFLKGKLPDADALRSKLRPCPERLQTIRYAFKSGWSVAQVHEATRIDPWFLDQMKQLADFEGELMRHRNLDEIPGGLLRRAKEWGFSDEQIAGATRATAAAVRKRRKERGIAPVYKLVDTCAAEFEAYTPYYYSAYETPFRKPGAAAGAAAAEDEIRLTTRKKVMILGGGPNRIGQGIEFDYCCVQAAFALREEGFESIMVNSNPETVSTDYDTSDLLFFEPLTLEDVLNICDRLRPDGVIVQFGGQTPLNLARGLEAAGVKIIGTPPDSIDRAGDRDRFTALVRELGLRQAPGTTVTTLDAAREAAAKLGYPVLVRPSFVLGGRAMEIVNDESQLAHFMGLALEAARGTVVGVTGAEQPPVLIDKFLSDAIEVDVDCVSDGETTLVCGVMEHIEEAGVHSGDSACCLPPFSLGRGIIEELKSSAYRLAKALGVVGLMNIQFAVKDGVVYVLEVNPRASRTVPFVSKATGISWAKIAAQVMVGRKLKDLGVTSEPEVKHFSVKESVFPFNRFPGVDTVLGPEMKSTGEVMGIDEDYGAAFAKSQDAAGLPLPRKGTVFISVRKEDHKAVAWAAGRFVEMGFRVLTTAGTGAELARMGIRTEVVKKIKEGSPNIADEIKNGRVDLIINTPTQRGKASDEGKLRSLAAMRKIPLITTLSGANAAANAVNSLRTRGPAVHALQDFFPHLASVAGAFAKKG